MILLILDFLSNLLDSWLEVWNMFEQFLNGFAQFGLSGAGDSIEKYGDAKATPTTKLLGVVYVIAQIAPGLIFTYMVSKYVTASKVRQVAIALLGGFVWFALTSYILGFRPGAREAYHKFAYGPMAVLTTIKEMFIADPVQAFTVWVVIFGTFFLFSFVLWYLINFTLWVVTSYRQDPLFSNTSAKALSLWLTVIWIFYLTLGDPSGAFVNTMFFLFVILISRSKYEPLGGDPNPGGGGGPPAGEMTYDDNVDVDLTGEAKVVGNSNPPDTTNPPDDSSDSSGGSNMEWID